MALWIYRIVIALVAIVFYFIIEEHKGSTLKYKEMTEDERKYLDLLKTPTMLYPFLFLALTVILEG
jgi:hypothetical protein